MKLKVVVGSTNRLKIEAVRAACSRFALDAEIVSVPAPVHFPCGVTPYDYLNIMDAANLRIHEAAERKEAAGAYAILGIQLGILRKDISWFATECVNAATEDGKFAGGSWTRQVLVPNDCVRKLLSCPVPNTSLGAVVAECAGGDPSDPYPALTNGELTRHVLLAEALDRVFRELTAKVQPTPTPVPRTSLLSRLLRIVT